GLIEYAAPRGDGQFQASLSLYDATWAPTEQIPERAIGTLVPDQYGTLDPTLRGSTERQVLTVGYQSDAWRLTGYLQHYDWSLLNNFTFFLDDPVNGDQRRQYEKRWTYGGRVERTFELDDRLSLRLGSEARVDDLGPVGLDNTVGGTFLSTVGAFDVLE